MDSVRIDLAALGLRIVIPEEIPGVAGTNSIPKDKERQGCPPNGDPDVASRQKFISPLLE